MVILNVTIFIAIRYLSLLSAFLFGMGAAGHYKYESYAYIPGTVIHLAVLLFFFVKKHRLYGWSFKSYQYLILILLICFLSVAGFMGLISYKLIPY